MIAPPFDHWYVAASRVRGVVCEQQCVESFQEHHMKSAPMRQPFNGLCNDTFPQITKECGTHFTEVSPDIFAKSTVSIAARKEKGLWLADNRRIRKSPLYKDIYYVKPPPADLTGVITSGRFVDNAMTDQMITEYEESLHGRLPPTCDTLSKVIDLLNLNKVTLLRGTVGRCKVEPNLKASYLNI